jgi:hypothetical protein
MPCRVGIRERRRNWTTLPANRSLYGDDVDDTDKNRWL